MPVTTTLHPVCDNGSMSSASKATTALHVAASSFVPMPVRITTAVSYESEVDGQDHRQRADCDPDATKRGGRQQPEALRPVEDLETVAVDFHGLSLPRG